MRPGAWTVSGFLAADASLGEVLEADARELERLSVGADELGARLRDLLERGSRSDWFRGKRVGEHRVELHRRRGMLTCPWAPEEFTACPVGRGSGPTSNEFLIVHVPTRARLEGLELHAHLIGDHGFFGGPGTEYRLEPADVAAALASNP
jgi:hypothetical protein